jgi:hypothetical protein
MSKKETSCNSDALSFLLSNSPNRFLNDLDYAKNPIDLYLQTQQEHIINLMNDIFERHKSMQDDLIKSWVRMNEKNENIIREGQLLTFNLKRMLIDATTHAVEKNTGSQQLDQKLWMAKVNVVKDLLGVLSKKLPDFMKIASSTIVADLRVCLFNIEMNLKSY